MGKLWDEFKKNMTYEEPQVRSGYREKSLKELEEERNSKNSLLKISQNKLQEDLNKKNINGRVFGKHIEAESAPSRNELKVGNKFAESENDNTSSIKTKPYDKNAILKDVDSVKKVRQYGNDDEEQNLINDVKKKWSDRAYAISDYETAKAIQDEENMNQVSRLGYSLYSGGKSLFKSFVRGDLQTEEGTTLDSYNDAINSKIGQRSKVYQISSELGKEVTKYGLNAILPGLQLGTALYTTDIAQRTYNDAKKEGYSDNSARLYGLLVGGMDYALNKIGTDVSTKFAKGGANLDTKQTILENLVDKGLKKVIKNKAMENIATSFVSNGLEEWSQEYIQDFLKYYSLDVLDKGASANPLDFIKSEKDSDVNQRAIESFIVGGFVGGIGGGFGELKLTKQQRNTQQAIYDYERRTGHELSNANQNTIAMIANTYQENVGRTPNSKEILDTFKNIRQSQIDTFQKPALEMFSDLGEKHRTEYNNLVNDVSQIIYDTGINVKFDPNQQTVINSENGTIILNPTLTDMPIKNVLLHEISKQTVDNDTKNYILNKLKNDGVYETYKNELLATGEFDEANVDSEIVAQELDAIFQNENEMKELAQKDKGLFNSIKDTFNTLTGKLTNNRNTKDALYFREVNDRLNKIYTKGNLDDLSKISDNLINNTKEEETMLKTNENGAEVDNLGRKIPDSYQKGLKDSKIRDNNGKLQVMYHGTPDGSFENVKGGSYFTSNKEYADGYQNTWASSLASSGKKGKLPKTYEAYLNIKNPFTLKDNTAKNIYLNEYIKGGNSAYYDPYTDYTDTINNLDEIDWVEGEDLKEWLNENHPEYDGLILDEGGDGGYGGAEYKWRGYSVVPFNSDQIINIDQIDFNQNTQDNTDVENNIGKEAYKSNEKLPETTKTGTYIEPTTPIDLNSKKGKKYLNQISGDSKYSSLVRAKSKNYTAFVDKLNPIQEIADASGNNQLYPKFNNRGMSNGMGQYQLGTAQTDINGVEIGKSLNDIWLPVENAKLVDEFNDYLAHRLNEERYDKVPVWDESVTPEISREKINEYETKYPQFKKWNKDVYKYNDNLLQKMIDAGLSKENARDWLYKNYVTIARDLGNGTSPLLTNAKGVKVNSPIRKAKGGNYDMRPMKESMARQTLLTERAIADNIAGQELLNVLGGKVGDSKTYLGEDLEGNNNALMKNQDGTYNYTVYKNGIPVTMQITKEVADAIRPTQRGEWENLFIPKVAQTVSKWQRTLLTDKNPLFIFTNFFKDFGDALLNSKYTAGEYFTMYPQAIAKMASNSPEWKQYVAKGGKSNTYFDVKEGEVKLSKNPIKRGGQKFLQAVENANQFIEQAPRFTEYLNSLAHGESQDVALYNSAEITTNFARGGEITKALNRNGFNFLNASVQGFDKQIRNFKNQPGAKGYVQLLAKVIALGVAPAMLNHILLEDDDDYEELPDYIKDNYYLFKTGDNKFIRIPKGRALSVFGTSAMHTYNVAKGKEELGSALNDTTETLLNNVAPNNPLENNVASPLISYKTNIAWNGSPIVPKRLQSLPESEQYDEKTSSIAKWLGQTLESSPLGKSFDFSPKKIDYLLDQYTGAIGDFVLPMTTPSAESDIDSPVGKLVIAPFKSKFTSDSTISSKYVSDFYDTKDQLDKEMKFVSDIEESEETFRKSLQAKYLASVNQEMSELYAQKRTIENSDLNDSDKYNQARAIQRKIDDIAKFALQDYQTGYYTDDYAVVGDKEYYISWNNTSKKFTWTAVSDKTKKKQEEYAKKYDMSPEEYYSMDLLTKSKIAGISGGKYEDYVKLNDQLTKITDNTHDDKKATFEFVNNLDIPMIQKAMFIKMHYPSYRDYDQEIFNWVDANTYNEYEAKAMLIKLGFYYDKKTNTYYAKEPKKKYSK